MKREAIIFLYLITIINSFSEGRDVMNFYEPLDFENRFGAYVEVKKDSNSDDYNYVYGDGLIRYNEEWLSEYDVRKKNEKNIKIDGQPDRDVDGWESTLSLYKILEPLKINEKQIYNDAGFVYFYDQINDTGTVTTTSERSEFRGRYRLRFDSNIGKGGSYSGFDLYAGAVHSGDKSGYHHELNFVNSTNLGYGFQNITNQANEILDYDNYDSTYRPSLENILKWTVEFDTNWAFSTELYANFEKYCNGSTEDYNIEGFLIPYFLYDNLIRENFSVYGKIGVLGYGFNQYKSGEKTYTESGQYMNITLGFNYFW